MPFEARVIQILIASPGDVATERAIIADVIYEWNSVNARYDNVVLMPLRWETDARPDLSVAPQTAINHQVADHADMVIGVFWTRLGTPTGDAESGTVAEIDRAGNAGKPVMLYFSKEKVELDEVNLAEYQRLKEFKDRTYPRGIVETYGSTAEFRTKLVRQLGS